MLGNTAHCLRFTGIGQCIQHFISCRFLNHCTSHKRKTCCDHKIDCQPATICIHLLQGTWKWETCKKFTLILRGNSGMHSHCLNLCPFILKKLNFLWQKHSYLVNFTICAMNSSQFHSPSDFICTLRQFHMWLTEFSPFRRFFCQFVKVNCI